MNTPREIDEKEIDKTLKILQELLRINGGKFDFLVSESVKMIYPVDAGLDTNTGVVNRALYSLEDDLELRQALKRKWFESLPKETRDEILLQILEMNENATVIRKTGSVRLPSITRFFLEILQEYLNQPVIKRELEDVRSKPDELIPEELQWLEFLDCLQDIESIAQQFPNVKQEIRDFLVAVVKEEDISKYQKLFNLIQWDNLFNSIQNMREIIKTDEVKRIRFFANLHWAVSRLTVLP